VITRLAVVACYGRDDSIERDLADALAVHEIDISAAIHSHTGGTPELREDGRPAVASGSGRISRPSAIARYSGDDPVRRDLTDPRPIGKVNVARAVRCHTVRIGELRFGSKPAVAVKTHGTIAGE